MGPMSFSDSHNPSHPRETRRAYVLHGRVQGVGFRWWTREIALELRLRGTVRNLADGSVEIHVAGPTTAVEAFVARVRAGPRHARITAMEEIPCRAGLPEPFQISL